MLDQYREMQMFFDAKAESWRSPIPYDQRLGKLFARLDFPARSRILDLGCGTGRALPYILERARNPEQIIAVDISAQMLRNMPTRLRSQCSILQGMIELLPLRDASVDVLLNCCVFPHLIRKELALREFYRVLKPGGSYYILHPEGIGGTNRIHRQAGPPVHEHLLPSNQELIRMVTNAGFTVLETVDEDHNYLLSAKKAQRPEKER